jgi:hypothetical protein
MLRYPNGAKLKITFFPISYDSKFEVAEVGP